MIFNKRSVIFLFLTGLLTIGADLSASVLFGPYRLIAGPEVYYSKRKVEGGAFQNSTMTGFRLNFDRLPCSGVYLGAEGEYAVGTARGETRSGIFTKSRMREYQAEGRLGWSFPVYPKKHLITVPYVGYGRYVLHNDFVVSPMPTDPKLQESYQYYTGGVLIEGLLTRCIQVGLHGRINYSIHARSTDSANDTVRIIESEKQYQIDVPITYRAYVWNKTFRASLTPFYRFHHFGGREGIINFSDTKMVQYGAKLAMNMYF